MVSSAAIPAEPVPAPPLTVVVVIPNELARYGIASMLRSVPCVGRVHVSADLAQVEQLVDSVGVDVLVLGAIGDLGPDAHAFLAKASTLGLKVLAVMSRGEAEQAAVAGNFIADGYLLDSELTTDSLDDALRRLRRGDAPIPTVLMRQLITWVRADRRQPVGRPALTPRELETLALLAEGLSNKQIARQLHISEHGAKRHVANVLAKLNCPNRTLAVAQAMRIGLLRDT
jgi:two-component system nitrate/nitrite response regulator NarL